ncbi:MAG: nitrite reductase [Planctomycetota bacterium]|nr:MAG: nitrite reductase [Planctomycetota bacterium]
MDEKESEGSRYRTVARLGEIPEGEGRAYVVAGRLIAVFHVDGRYFAIDDTCPHAGASLAGGRLEGRVVYCPWHAWRFSIEDGLWMDNPRSNIRTGCYRVRVVGEEIQVAVPEDDSAATGSACPGTGPEGDDRRH